MATKISHDKLLLPIMRAFMRYDADFKKFPSELYGQMRLFITDFVPVILVSDGFNQVEAEFSKECINDFRRMNNHIKFSAQRDKVIYVQEWQLELKHRQCDSSSLNFQNLGIVFQVTKFKLLAREHVNKWTLSQIENAYIQDELLRYYISKFIHQMTKDMAYSLAEFDFDDDSIFALAPTQDDNMEDLDQHLEKLYGAQDQSMDQIKRIFIEERGEQEWQYMYNMAIEQIKNYWELSKERQNHLNNIKYVQIQPLDRQVIKTVAPLQNRMRTQWKAGASASTIKQQVLRILEQAPNFRKLRAPERERAYSQEDHPASLILDEASHHGREALSQFVANPNDFDTETDDEDEGCGEHKIVQSNFQTYQKYISWFQEHDINDMQEIRKQEKIRIEKEQEEQRLVEEELMKQEELRQQQLEIEESQRLEKQEFEREQLNRLKQEKERREKEVEQDQEMRSTEQPDQNMEIEEEFKVPLSKRVFCFDDDEEDDDVQMQLNKEMEIIEKKSTPTQIVEVQIEKDEEEVKHKEKQEIYTENQAICEVKEYEQKEEVQIEDKIEQIKEQIEHEIKQSQDKKLSDDEIFEQKMMQRMLERKLEAERQRRLANMTEEEKQEEKEREEKEKKNKEQEEIRLRIQKEEQIKREQQLKQKEEEDRVMQEIQREKERENQRVQQEEERKEKEIQIQREEQEKIRQEQQAEEERIMLEKQKEQERLQEIEKQRQIEKENLERKQEEMEIARQAQIKQELELKQKQEALLKQQEEEENERKRQEAVEEQKRLVLRQKEAEIAHYSRINEAQQKKILLEDKLEQTKIKQQRQRYKLKQEEQASSPDTKRKKKEARKRQQNTYKEQLDQTIIQIQQLTQVVQTLQQGLLQTQDSSSDSEDDGNNIRSETESEQSEEVSPSVLGKRQRKVYVESDDEEDQDITPKRQKRDTNEDSPTPPDEILNKNSKREQTSVAKAILKSTKKHDVSGDKNAKEVRFSQMNEEMTYVEVSSSQDSSAVQAGFNSKEVRKVPSDQMSIEKRKLMKEVFGVLSMSSPNK